MDYRKEARSILICGLCMDNKSHRLTIDQTKEMIDELMANGDITEEDIYETFIGPAPRITIRSNDIREITDFFLDKIKHLIPCELMCERNSSEIYSIGMSNSKDLRKYCIERVLNEQPDLIQNIGIDLIIRSDDSLELLDQYLYYTDKPNEKIFSDIHYWSGYPPSVLRILCEKYILPVLDTIDNFNILHRLWARLKDEDLKQVIMSRLKELIYADYDKKYVYAVIRYYMYDLSMYELSDAYEEAHGRITIGSDEYPFYRLAYECDGACLGNKHTPYVKRIQERFATTDDVDLLLTYGFWNIVQIIYPMGYYEIRNIFTDVNQNKNESQITYVNKVIQDVVDHIRTNCQ